MQRPEYEKSRTHSRRKKLSGRSPRALSLKDVKHGCSVASFFALEEAPWSTMDIGLKCSMTQGREAI